MTARKIQLKNNCVFIYTLIPAHVRWSVRHLPTGVGIGEFENEQIGLAFSNAKKIAEFDDAIWEAIQLSKNQ